MYTPPNKGQALYRRAKQIIPGGTQLLSKRPEMYLPDQWPSYYESCNGCQIVDIDGNTYLDFSTNSVGACTLGYRDPDVEQAVQTALTKGPMCSLNCYEEVELAERLIALHPWADMARFARTGGEAAAVAVRIARAATGRSVIAFSGYHGWHDWYLAANLAEADTLGEKGLLLSGLNPRGVPKELRNTSFGFRHGRLEELETIINQHGDNLAAIVIEPQRFEQPEDAFLEGVRTLATQCGAVLIYDEITSGFRKNFGGLHLKLGHEPDVAIFGKALGNGHPIGSVIGRSGVMEAAQDSFISSTYWTERIGPAAALAFLDKYEKEKVHEHLCRIGSRVQQVWTSCAAAVGIDVDVGHPDMPPLSHFAFQGADSRALKTLYCQYMVERGILDNAAAYITFAHREEHLAIFERAASVAFEKVKAALDSGDVEGQLNGPVGHSGFKRLT